jgi:hypothetical protein
LRIKTATATQLAYTGQRSEQPAELVQSYGHILEPKRERARAPRSKAAKQTEACIYMWR